MNKNTIQFFRPMIIVFVIITALCLIFSQQLEKYNINHEILLGANIILFVLMIITSLLHIRALRNPSPYAFVRSITLGVFLKLIVIAAAVLIYFYKSGANINIYTVALAMLLYIVYTVFEVAGAMRLNRKRNAES
jgi:hypothetical protein